MIYSDNRRGCGCQCHTNPGVMHIMACCDEPPAIMERKNMLTFTKYQQLAASTAVYPKVLIAPDVEVWDGDVIESLAEQEPIGFLYPALGLVGEAGEVAEKIKKLVRDRQGIVDDDVRVAVAKELGDVMWYLAALCKEFGLDMGEVAQGNLDKLAARAAKGTLGGSGDNR